ncbi:CHAT domain-containing protein [Mycena vulgaris]|nr:CHAT domain-containing protein [Mycena vulgaris]
MSESPFDKTPTAIQEMALLAKQTIEEGVTFLEQASSISEPRQFRQECLNSAISCLRRAVESHNALNASATGFKNANNFEPYDLVVTGLEFYRDSQCAHHSSDSSSMLAQAVSHLDCAVIIALSPSTSTLRLDSHPDRQKEQEGVIMAIMALKYLGHVLSEFFKRITHQPTVWDEAETGRSLINDGDVDGALSYFIPVANCYPRERYPHPDRFLALESLGYIWNDCFKRDRNIEAGVKALACLREAQDLCPKQYLPPILNTLGLCLMSFFDHYRSGFKQEGDIHSNDRAYCESYLNSAITHMRAACDLQTNPVNRRSLGRAYVQLFGYSYKGTDLAEAIRWLEPVYSDQSLGEFDRAIVGLDLSRAYSELYAFEDDIIHLEKAAQWVRNAIQVHEKTGEVRSHFALLHCKLQFGNILSMFYELRGTPGHLEEAIFLFDEVLASNHTPDIKQSATQSLGEALYKRCLTVNGSNPDLTRVITLLQSIPNRGGRASPILSRYSAWGTTKDLSEAIRLSRADSLHHEASLQPRAYQCLSDGLLKRFLYLGLPQDLEDAIVASRTCQCLLPEGHSQWSPHQHRVASLLVTRFDALRDPKDLEEALDLHSQALRTSRDAKPDAPVAPNILLEYARALHAQWQTRTETDSKASSLEQAISLTKNVLDRCRATNHPDYITAQLNLSEYLCDAYVGDLDLEPRDQTLANAEEHLNSVAQSLPTTHPLNSHRLRNMAIIYFHRGAYDRAFEYFFEAANHPSATTRERLRIAVAWIHFAQKSGHKSVSDAFVKAMTLREECMLLSPDVGLQWEFLRFEQDGASFASCAAALAINEGKVKEAVEIIEQGRNLIWSAMGKSRQSLVDLQKRDPGLFEKLRKNLGEAEWLALSTSESWAPEVVDDHIRKRQEYLTERIDILNQVRSLEGHQSFGLPAGFSELRKAAAEGEVIIVNTSSSPAISHAIIVSTSADPVAIRLAHLEPKDVADLVDDLKKAQESVTRARQYTAQASEYVEMSQERDEIQAKIDEHSKAASVAFEAILLRLWEDLVHLVEGHIAPATANPRRIWWCVTGALCALPVHAAAMYANPSKSAPYYLSSYTSSLTALIAARQTLPNEGGNRTSLPSLLLVGGSLVEGGTGKSCVEVEMDRIKKYIPANLAAIEENDFSNRDSVIECLPRHPWVHFACHGEQDTESPFKSCLYRFPDHKVTLLDIMRARPSNAKLAILSACRTATGDVSQTPDETLHVAQGLQFCGFKSVVGTLWEMSDDEGPQVFGYFYQFFKRELPIGKQNVHTRSALCLRRTLNAMIEKNKMPVYEWINYVHIGA